MKRVVTRVMGLVLGLAVGAGVSGIWYGCSCPPGYKPKRIADGTYTIRAGDAGADVGTVVVAGSAVTATLPSGTATYHVEYKITGTH